MNKRTSRRGTNEDVIPYQNDEKYTFSNSENKDRLERLTKLDGYVSDSSKTNDDN